MIIVLSGDYWLPLSGLSPDNHGESNITLYINFEWINYILQASVDKNSPIAVSLC